MNRPSGKSLHRTIYNGFISHMGSYTDIIILAFSVLHSALTSQSFYSIQYIRVPVQEGNGRVYSIDRCPNRGRIWETSFRRIVSQYRKDMGDSCRRVCSDNGHQLPGRCTWCEGRAAGHAGERPRPHPACIVRCSLHA
jgi:hypothetical protein